MKLTPKRIKFCEEYVIDFDGTKAAIRTKYSKKTATKIASHLLTIVEVQEYIAELVAKRSKKTEITAEYVLTSLQEVAQRCMQKVPVLNKDGKETGKWKFEASGANRSLELIGRHLEMFTERLRVEGDIKITVEDLRDSNIDES